MIDQFSRTRQLIGQKAMEKLSESKVAVFGLGAVGSFATEALARCGIGQMQLVDFDRIEISNINRQLYALHSTVGNRKAFLAKERINDINPDCRVTIQSSFVTSDSIPGLLEQDTDLVIDAIDGLNSKVNLIVEARNMGLEVVSSMGAAGRLDISGIRTGDISDTRVCPLARMVRQRLHRRDLYTGVTCVYSIEKPLNKKPCRDSRPKDTKVDYGHGRPRPPIGSMPYVTGAFGLYAAMAAVSLLTGISGGQMENS